MGEGSGGEELWPSSRCLCLLPPAASHRMWALQRLRKLLTTEFGQSVNIRRLLGDSDGEARALVGSHPGAGPVAPGARLR